MLLNIKNVIERLLGFMACTLIIALSVIALWQVFTRYVLNDPSTHTEELLRYLMIWMGFFGATYCFSTQRHLSLTLLETKLSAQGKRHLHNLHHLIIIVVIALVMVVGGSRFVAEGMGQASSTLGIQMGYIYLIMPLSGVIICVLEGVHFLLSLQSNAAHEEITE